MVVALPAPDAPERRGATAVLTRDGIRLVPGTGPDPAADVPSGITFTSTGAELEAEQYRQADALTVWEREQRPSS